MPHGLLSKIANKVKDVHLADEDEEGEGGSQLGEIKQLVQKFGPDVVQSKFQEKVDVPLPPTEVHNRKALLIGINYLTMPPGQGQLKGCINDALNVRTFLIERGWDPNTILILTDDQQGAGAPTRENMLNGMRWLVEGASVGDSLFFHFAGHGGQEVDATGLEEDGLNETIMPVDFKTAGQINDDTIHDILVRGLPAGVRLTAVFDSCHSGTVMDLPYVYHSEADEYKKAHKEDDGGLIGRHVELSQAVAGNPKNFAGNILNHLQAEILHQGNKHARRAVMANVNTSDAFIMMIAGCRDEQTSADTTFDGQSTGAMSYAFMKVLREQGEQTWTSLIKNMRDTLHHGPKEFQQMPQLSMGRPVDPDLPVIF